jgi:hypothetical protein
MTTESQNNNLCEHFIRGSGDFNIYNYWILTSHNTYLIDTQMSQPQKCMYELLRNLYKGGSVEIDINYSMNNESIISHSVMPSSLKLAEVLKLYSNTDLQSPPLIISIDNTSHTNMMNDNLTDIINKNLLNKKAYCVKQGTNLNNIPLKHLCNTIFIKYKTDDEFKLGKMVCNSDRNDLVMLGWSKNHENLTHKIFGVSIQGTNDHDSTHLNDITMNHQIKMFRIYPPGLNINSGNFNIYQYFEAGAQMVAINLQRFDNNWYINRALFTDNTIIPRRYYTFRTKPDELKVFKHLQIFQIILNNNLSFSAKISLRYGRFINNKIYFFPNMYISNINISLPLFVIKIYYNGIVYKDGIELSMDNSDNIITRTFYLDQFIISTGNCQNLIDRHINKLPKLRVTIKYKYL